ncbi:MAG: hypothetical protein ACO1O1_06550 [Adhaeribacter sp.]
MLLLFAAALGKALFFSGTAGTPHLPSAVRPAAKPRHVRVPAGQQYSRSFFGTWWLGKHWRALWTSPVEAPVLDFSRTLGGLQPGEMGGGMQTTSLRLTSADGRSFVLRSLDKDPVGVLPGFWQHTLLADLVRDQVAAANPYAPLVVAPLSQAAGLLHPHPRLVFIPAAEPRIRAHQARMGNRLFWLEEKFTASSVAAIDSAQGIYDSVEMLDLHYRAPGHLIDQRAFVRCRLFDILLGDWDRHEGQWDWVAYRQGPHLRYRPIPKDRDQAFSRYRDGLLPGLLTQDFALPKFAHFDGSLQDIRPFTVNSAFLDQRALNALQREDFLQAAGFLQQVLTDQVIDQAVRQLPPPIYQLAGRELAGLLKQRRRQLKQAAGAFHRHLAQDVLVAGTDVQDKFVVRRLNDRQTLVEVFSMPGKDSLEQRRYRRVFYQGDTHRVTLYGLAGNDHFDLSGQVNQGIQIRIVGGRGADVIRDRSLVRRGEKKTLVLDTRKGNHIEWGPETVDKTSDNLSVHHFDREGY